MIRCFKAVVDRHRKREQSRNQILLGTELHSDKFKSKQYDEHVANIRENCSGDASGNLFKALIKNYHDEDYFSTDTDLFGQDTLEWLHKSIVFVERFRVVHERKQAHE